MWFECEGELLSLGAGGDARPGSDIPLSSPALRSLHTTGPVQAPLDPHDLATCQRG